MTTRITAALGVAAAALLLAACGPEYGPGTTSTPSDQTGYVDPTADASSIPDDSATAGGDMTGEAASLMTAETDLGTIVTDGDGMVVYQFDQDTQGSGMSSCTGDCLVNWPPVPGGDNPTLDGITGEVTTITGTDGNPQLALNGWPLYYYAGDSAAGDTNGQAVQDVWWVIDPAGTPIHG